MKKLILLAALPSAIYGYTVHCINGLDKPLDFHIKTSLLGCVDNDQRDVPAGKTVDFNLSGVCKGACITSVRVNYKDGNEVGTADFGAGACEDVDVMAFKKIETHKELGFSVEPTEWDLRSTEGKTGFVMYGDSVVLQSSEKWALGADDLQNVTHDRTKFGPWEKWTIMKPGDEKYRGRVSFGEPMLLKSAFSKYLGFDEQKQVITVTSDTPGPQTTWTFDAQPGPVFYSIPVRLKNKTSKLPYFGMKTISKTSIVVDKHGGGNVGHIIQKGFEDFGKVIQIDQVRKFPEILQKSFEISGLGIKLGALIAAKESSKGFMEGMRDASGKFLKSLPEIIKGLQVRKIEFEGSAREMFDGVFPKGSFEVVVAGKKVEVNDITLNLAEPVRAIHRAVDSMVDVIKSWLHDIVDFGNQIDAAFKKTFK